MVLSVSAVVLLGALAVLLWRFAGLRAWHAMVCVMFGFFLAATTLAPGIQGGADVLARLLAGLHL